MKASTFERAPHMWPEWGESIIQSRELSGYDLKWPQPECEDWASKNYPKIRAQGEAELRRLELPPTLQDCWEDCFYADYRNQDGSTNYGKVTRFISDCKSYPKFPCEAQIAWYGDEDTHDPWLRVEFRLHARSATKELYDYAARHGYSALKHYPVLSGTKGR